MEGVWRVLAEASLPDTVDGTQLADVTHDACRGFGRWRTRTDPRSPIWGRDEASRRVVHRLNVGFLALAAGMGAIGARGMMTGIRAVASRVITRALPAEKCGVEARSVPCLGRMASTKNSLLGIRSDHTGEPN